MKNDKLKYILYPLLIIGFVITVIYVFYTSNLLLTSDSLVDDVIAHQQRINNQFILKDWIYLKNFNFITLTPTWLLSHILKNNLLIHQISTVIVGIVFFVLLYIYGKKMLNKKSTLILITIFLSGISYGVLNYFYVYNSYLLFVVNSLILLYLYYKMIKEKSNLLYLILSVVLTLLFCIGTIDYLITVIIPFIILVLFVSLKKRNKDFSNIFKICFLVLAVIVARLIYHYLQSSYNIYSGIDFYKSFNWSTISKNILAFLDCIFNFFGFDNRNNPLASVIGDWYFINEEKEFYIFSLRNICYIFKFLSFLYFILITPIILIKKRKDSDKIINLLFIYNSISWIFLIFIYLFTTRYSHNYIDMHYFMFNIIVSIILGLYCIQRYLCKNKNLKLLVEVCLICYLISNIFISASIVLEHNTKKIKNKEIVRVLQKNNLKHGYASYYDGLYINYFSNYKIEVVPINYMNNNKIIKRNTNVKWHYHKGRTFILFNPEYSVDYLYYLYFLKPDKVIKYRNYVIAVYDKNPIK